ncbi:MAG: ATP-dependent Clp protease ATP-binding subunit ClpX, partial [Myxococcales bacterium]|nr:ATP-dependent Clp protease ATP-binding subunit ClpX [Myxococcales bacterium]
EPKNALTRQYKRLFDMDGVKLTFTESSLRQVARKALERKTGARGLRAILESVMLDVMYDVPSDPNIREVVVSDECVTENKRPMLVYEAKAESA